MLFENIGIPPKTIVTRWGTWLNVCHYLSQNFPKVKNIIQGFKPDSKIVADFKASVGCSTMSNDLFIIQREYSWLVDLIEKCNQVSYTIEDSINDLLSLDIKNDVVKI